MNQRTFRQRGQAMTEYMIVVAVVAVAAIVVYQSFGQVVRSQTSAITRELAGQDGTTESAAARNASSTVTKRPTLRSFTGNVVAAPQSK